MVNIYSVHMDPKTWEDPKNFRPERFLDKDNNVILKDRIIPFGVGELNYTVLYMYLYSATHRRSPAVLTRTQRSDYSIWSRRVLVRRNRVAYPYELQYTIRLTILSPIV